ncbi:scavenger receptor cysteine-rich type 1 protein M130-like [Scyliorhinus torazame]|uniref:scavenger receptor cysteine-rich type 1 protein M130-like n=1 Tax=Scyliorhinus torazame TaxID=75743 RepID=UPI003B58D363
MADKGPQSSLEGPPKMNNEMKLARGIKMKKNKFDSCTKGTPAIRSTIGPLQTESEDIVNDCDNFAHTVNNYLPEHSLGQDAGKRTTNADCSASCLTVLSIRSVTPFTLAPEKQSGKDNIPLHYFLSGHKQLSLSDGGSRCAGRLEIYYSGIWGSVCDDTWDLTDAEVVGKQLGCGNALQLPFPAASGPGTGTIWLDELDCSGNESSIWQCPHALWGNHDCNHKEDVEIMCSEHKELRLVNGKHRCEGRVEVFYNGTWGTVCSDKLENRDADVICKQLECGTADFIDYDAKSFGMGTGHIWLDEIECLSHETTLWQCQGDPWGQHNCEHREDAGIVCSDPLFSPTSSTSTPEDSATINTLNQIEYYSSHSLGDTDPGSVHPEDECSNIQGM